LWHFDLFCGHLVYFVVIWYFFPILVYCITKNLATPLAVRRGSVANQEVSFSWSATVKILTTQSGCYQKCIWLVAVTEMVIYT
jgi:hypothetical protein